MRKLSYHCLVIMRTNALWACEIWAAQARNFRTIGAIEEANRYYKIMNRIEKAMFDYPI